MQKCGTKWWKVVEIPLSLFGRTQHWATGQPLRLMIRFYGTYEIKLDAKGRMALPSKYRSQFANDKLVITKGYETCLTIYPTDEFEKVFEEINALSEFVEEHRILKRSVIPNSVELEFDSSGRILIPKMLLNWASIDKDVKLLGVGNKIEVWNNQQLEPNVVPAQQVAAYTEKVMGSKKREG
jgi:MraZ protein